MASTLQRLLRRSQPTRLFTRSRTSPAPNLTTPPIFPQSDPFQIPNPSPLLVLPKAQNLTSDPFSLAFPSFPFGFGLNPISSSGSVSPETEDVEFDDSGTVWADSVKKKRKRKMNKHKYHKLRKRVSRQT